MYVMYAWHVIVYIYICQKVHSAHETCLSIPHLAHGGEECNVGVPPVVPPIPFTLPLLNALASKF